MNRLLLLGLGAVVVIAGVVGFILMRSGASTPSAEQASVTSAPQSEVTPTTANTEMTLQELLARGGDQKCTWAGDMGGQQMNGVVYISGHKVRSEATGTMPSIGPFTAYVIGDGTTMTIWTSIAPSHKTTMAYADMDHPSPTGQAAFNSFAQKKRR